MTIYQEEMQRKALRYGCTTGYDEEKQMLLIAHKGVPLAEITDKGFMSELLWYVLRYQTIADMKADKVAQAHYLPTIEKLLAQGVLKGKGGSGDALILDLGEDAARLLVILDRAGVFDK